MTTARIPRLVLGAAAVAALLASAAAPASAGEIPLRPGDRLEMAVVGVPDLARKAVVGEDGVVALPLFGDVEAGGRTVGDLRRDLRARLPGLAYRPKTTTGSDRVVGISANDLILETAERRPVYVTGGVAVPGQRPFRPGMTVRQAVAEAGGFGIAGMRGSGLMALEDMRSEYEGLWTSYAAAQARVMRLEAAAAGRAELPAGALADVPVRKDVADAILAAEGDRLGRDAADYGAERARLGEKLEQAQVQVANLEEQKRIQDDETAAARKDLADTRSMLSRGLVQGGRVTEARRAILMTAGLSVQTSGEILRTQGLMADYRGQLTEMESKRKGRIAADLYEARLQLEGATRRIRSTGRKLAWTGDSASRLSAAQDRTPDVVVHRVGPDGRDVGLEAGQDFALEPGDVVEVEAAPVMVMPGSPAGAASADSAASGTDGRGAEGVQGQ